MAIYFKALWACPSMPDHIQKNLSDQNVASMAVKLHEKSEIYTSNSFQHIRNSKSLQTDWPNTFSPTTREPGFSDKRILAEFQRLLSCIIYPPSLLPKKKKKKRHTLMDQIFFKIHIAYLLQSFLGQPSQTQRTHPEILAIYFRALWTCQACLTTPTKTVLLNCSFHGYLITSKKKKKHSF